MISHLGAMVSVTVGTLMAKRFQGEKNFVGLTCIGEGGMQTGAFHEGMNIAAVEQVPLVVVATNNHYAYSTPNEREFACDDLVNRATGYGFEGYRLDGTDLSACLDVIGGAVKRARAGRPPQLVVASVLRLSGHGEHDDASYVPEEMKSQPFARDCLKVAEQTIAELNLADPETLSEWRKEAATQVDEAIATAQKEPVPDADKEDWCALSNRELVDYTNEDE
jgi:pyruvate dehydrogenase E1 component alpha subunit/2-oxoisovalerate dehydrogenase E1 component alpha subunit